MLSRLFVPVLALGLSLAAAGPSSAQTADPGAALFEAMHMPELLDVMRLEGIDYGKQIATDLMPGGASPDWDGTVSAIYDTARMRQVVEADFAAALAGTDTQAMIDFFTSEPGRTIVGLEISARRAMLDPAIDDASKEQAAIAMADDTPRHQQIARFIQTNDLIETNVAGAMNANYAFYIGLMQGGGLGGALTEDQILTDVWGQEDSVRTSTTEWMFSFLTLAYQPLSDSDLDTYIAFSETDAGQQLNRAIFVAFDGLFEDISKALGMAASQQMGKQDL